MSFELPKLPFSTSALEPTMSAETLEYHHNKHHAGYVKKLNELILGTKFQDLSLEEIIKGANGPMLENAGQHWNHSFFWKSLTPTQRDQPPEIFAALEKDFHSIENFMLSFKQAGMGVFGSGWVSLVKKNGSLAIVTTRNGETPISDQQTPLLICDLWEHAYYLDYRNERAKYIDNFFRLANWDFATQNLSRLDSSIAA